MISNNAGYYPCDAILSDGSKVDRVYLAEATTWFGQWGVWPEDDAGKHPIDVKTLTKIVRSRHCLPTRFANQLYQAGESGMGYTIFTVHFSDGSRMPVASGNAVDFVPYPVGQSAETVVAVEPNVGRDERPQSGLRYHWCLFQHQSENRRSLNSN